MDDPARICTDYVKDLLPDPCLGNATVLPGLEPTLFAVVTLAAFAAMAMHWLAIFSMPKNGRAKTISGGVERPQHPSSSLSLPYDERQRRGLWYGWFYDKPRGRGGARQVGESKAPRSEG